METDAWSRALGIAPDLPLERAALSVDTPENASGPGNDTYALRPLPGGNPLRRPPENANDALARALTGPDWDGGNQQWKQQLIADNQPASAHIAQGPANPDAPTTAASELRFAQSLSESILALDTTRGTPPVTTNTPHRSLGRRALQAMGFGRQTTQTEASESTGTSERRRRPAIVRRAVAATAVAAVLLPAAFIGSESGNDTAPRSTASHAKTSTPAHNSYGLLGSIFTQPELPHAPAVGIETPVGRHSSPVTAAPHHHTGKHRAPVVATYKVKAGENPWQVVKSLEPQASDRQIHSDDVQVLHDSGIPYAEAGHISAGKKLIIHSKRLIKSLLQRPGTAR